MVHGQLISLPGYSRKGVALKISAKDIRDNPTLQVIRPGVFVFSGYWYGTDPLSFKSYGKIHHNKGRVVGRVRSHWHTKKLCA